MPLSAKELPLIVLLFTFNPRAYFLKWEIDIERRPLWEGDRNGLIQSGGWQKKKCDKITDYKGQERLDKEIAAFSNYEIEMDLWGLVLSKEVHFEIKY